jgi:tyrosine permease
MAQTVFKYSNFRLPASISVIVVSILVGAIAWYSSLLVGRITTILIIGKFVAFLPPFLDWLGTLKWRSWWTAWRLHYPMRNMRRIS